MTAVVLSGPQNHAGWAPEGAGKARPVAGVFGEVANWQLLGSRPLPFPKIVARGGVGDV
jgi:hypothetical protein